MSLTKKDKEKGTEDIWERQWLKWFVKGSKLGQNWDETEPTECRVVMGMESQCVPRIGDRMIEFREDKLQRARCLSKVTKRWHF